MQGAEREIRGVAGVIRNHGTIHKLIVEAYVEKSKEKLLHAILLEPIVDSYSAQSR